MGSGQTELTNFDEGRERSIDEAEIPEVPTVY